MSDSEYINKLNSLERLNNDLSRLSEEFENKNKERNLRLSELVRCLPVSLPVGYKFHVNTTFRVGNYSYGFSENELIVIEKYTPTMLYLRSDGKGIYNFDKYIITSKARVKKEFFVEYVCPRIVELNRLSNIEKVLGEDN